VSDNNYDDYTDVSVLGGNGEQLPGGGLAADTPGFKVTPPGKYLSQSRVVRGKKITKGDYAGHFEFEIRLEGGIIDPKTGKTFGTGKFPMTKKVSTIPFPLKDFDTQQPILNADGSQKKSSAVANYLMQFNYKPSNMTLNEVLDAMVETQAIPLGVGVGRTDKRVEGGVDPATGKTVWLGGELKTKDFQTGVDADGNPIYADVVTKDGQTYEAKAIVSYFFPADKL
jgi:hypothetical protein